MFSKLRRVISRKRISFVVGMALLALSGPTHADTVPLGVFSFNTLIPSAPGSPGVNDFEIDNLSGSFTTAPDFPIASSLTLQNSSIVLTLQGGSQQTVILGDLAPGTYTPALLQLSALDSFTSALFTATLNQTNLSLFSGTSASITTTAISVDLTPATGSSLVPNSDFALISINTEPTAVPEPCFDGFELALIAVGTSILKLHRGSR